MRTVIFGASSNIAKELNWLYLNHEIVNVSRSHEIFTEENFLSVNRMFCENDVVIYLSSILRAIRIEDQTYDQIYESLRINTLIPIKIMRHLNKCHQRFTFCYISSESALKGSYDDSYFIFKGAVERFIEEFHLNSTESRVFGISPSTILSGMTISRTDTERLETYRIAHRKGRFLDAPEFAKIVFLLCSKEFNYLSNTIVEVNGGKFARNKY